MTLRTNKILTMIVMDIFLIVEITFSFWKASRGEDFSESFIFTYAPMFIPTVTFFMWRLRRLNKRIAAEEEAAAMTVAPEAA